MTTSSERIYPPKKLVPVDESILVIMYKAPTQGKPFNKTVNGQDGKPTIKIINQVNFHFRIADSSHPELCGQPHILTATDFISAGDGSKKSPSKIHILLTAMGGQELAERLNGKYVFDSKDPAKLVPAEVWAPLVEQFYGATFSAPKLDDAGNMRLGDNGSPYQTVAEIKTLKSLRWKLEDCKLWPPPLGLPVPQCGQTSPTVEDRPLTPPEAPPAMESAKALDLDSIKALLSVPGPLRVVAKKYLFAKGVDAIGALKEDGLKHLLALLRIGEHINNGGLVAANANGHLEARKKELHQLDFEDAVFLLVALDKAAEDDVPF